MRGFEFLNMGKIFGSDQNYVDQLDKLRGLFSIIQVELYFYISLISRLYLAKLLMKILCSFAGQTSQLFAALGSILTVFFNANI